MRIRNEVKLFEGVLDPESGRLVNGASVSRVQASFIGDFHLALAPGVAGPPLTDGDQIPLAISQTGLSAAVEELAEITKIFPKVDKIVTDIGRITDSAAKVYGGEAGVDRFEALAEDMQEAARNIRDISGDIRQFVAENVVSQSDSIDRIVSNIERFTEKAASLSEIAEGRAGTIVNNLEVTSRELRELVAGSRGDVQGAASSARRLLERLEGSMGGAESTVSNVQDITRKINEGEGTIGRLVNDDALIRDVEEIVDDAGDFVDRITRLRAQVGLRSEYNFRASSLKTYVSLRLIPKEDKFYLIEVVDDPRGRTRFVDRTTLTNDPLQPPVLRETIAETTSDLKFSFQFGKQWHFMTGRFGIIESTGGVGLDAEFLDDTLKLSLDVFDFQADTWPRLKWLFSWEFVQHVYVAAGVDDIVNEVGRDYFLGLGVTFTDDDLKSLLTIGGIPSP
jgi:phospholipid/cholesterol/gamma-HCH transport system substrate-binding protein